MFVKLEITGTIEVLTGMHIGGSGAFSAIGSVDAPVIRDMYSGLPIIPGSSLKGKMRSLLAKMYNTNIAKKPDDDDPCLCSLFGCSKGKTVLAGRVLFSDMIMENWDELKSMGLTSRTEIKFENSINRASAVANPRQIERVIRGSRFPMNLIYEATEKNDIKKDFEILGNGFQLLEYDYLGGSGSRGYGKIKFSKLDVRILIGEIDIQLLEECKKLLSSYEV